MPLLKNAHILIIDDDPVGIQMLNHVLWRAGEVAFATSGEAGLQALGQRAFDLVLLDYEMPGLDGISVCRLIKNQHPELPVIFVTVRNDPEAEVLALSSGASDFISRPYSDAVVMARVNTQLRLRLYAERIRSQVMIDPLTGLANRRAMEEALLREYARTRRQGTPLSVMMVDVDHFKRFNDYYGHLEGDNVLAHVAEALRQCARRPGDVVARFGGEEFCVVLADAPNAPACSVAEAMLQRVRNLQLPHAGSTTQPYVTVSAGVATLHPPANAQAYEPNTSSSNHELLARALDLVRNADTALYHAKVDGRDRVVSYADLPPDSTMADFNPTPLRAA
ncbi:MAG: hypothetical protein RIQ60_3172 [Pseudomonadota bacterium]|jgi:diguanylate cyclase (GGDEF)-like protein